jgi:CheY-like chemotaxis protein
MKAATTHSMFKSARGRAHGAHLERRAHAAPGSPVIQGEPAASASEGDVHGGGVEQGIPRVLLIDQDPASAANLATLLMPEARVVHAPTLADARRLLGCNIFALVVIDPSLPDGDAGALVSTLAATPVLVHAAREPKWREAASAFLPKPWTSPRQLWSTISRLLGVSADMAAGD